MSKKGSLISNTNSFLKELLVFESLDPKSLDPLTDLLKETDYKFKIEGGGGQYDTNLDTTIHNYKKSL